MEGRGSYAAAVLSLLLLFCTNSWGMEAELKCSACEAVAAELERRLEAELPRQQLDLRHRLDKNGQRYGKIIDWKVSEIRAVNLLEDLCEAMEDYTLVTPSSSGTADGNSTVAEQQPQQQQPQPAWVKYKGDGSVKVAKSQRPGSAEEQLRAKQLKTFCGMLLESHEEEVMEALMSDQFSAGVTPVLCQQITSRCKGKDYGSSSSGSSSSEEGAGGAASEEL